MELKPERFQAVDGGQFDGFRPSEVPKNGWRRVLNMLSYNGRLNLREGYRTFSQGTPTISGITSLTPVTGLLELDPSYNDYAVLVGGELGTFALLNKNGVWDTPIPKVYAGAVPTDDMPWIFRQYKGIVYGARRNFGAGLVRIIASGWTKAGRPAPTTPLTTTFAVPGSNAWRFAYTYLDTLTGNESNPSPALAITSGAAGTIDLNAWSPADVDIVWDKYRLYATKANGGILFPIADLSAATTTYNFIIANAISGTLAYGSTALSTRNGVPDASTIAFDIWNERGWISEGEKVKYSAPGLIEGYSEIQNLPFNPNDNDSITTLYGWGDYFVIAKNRSAVLLSGYDRTSFEQKLWTGAPGCRAPHSMKDCEGKLVWLSESGFYSGSPHENPVNISSTTVVEALRTADPEALDKAVATVVPDRQLYIFLFPRVGGAWGGLAYNWRRNAWTEFDYAADPLFLTHGFDHNRLPRTFACSTGADNVLALFEGNDDDGVQIPYDLLSGAPETGGVNLAGLGTVSLLCTGTLYPVTFRAYRNGDGVIIRERTVRLEGAEGWKTIQLSTKRKLGTQLQVEILGAMRGPWSFSDMEWEVLVTGQNRRSF